MKTLLLTGSDSRMFNILDLTLQSKIKYCSQQGYDLFVKKEWLPINVPQLMHETQSWLGRPPVDEPWTKDSFLAHLTGANNHERIVIFNKIQNILNSSA